MNRIFFENVRCFHDAHACPLKPITLLVGENSSGKTTFLALTRIAWDISEGNLNDDLFNEEPFLLGSYDQIASSRRGKAGRAKSFTIGLQVPTKSNPKDKYGDLFAEDAKITARFISKGSESVIDEWRFECGKFDFVVNRSSRQEQLDITIMTSSGSYIIDGRIAFRGFDGVNRMLSDLFIFHHHNIRKKENTDTQIHILTETELTDLNQILLRISHSMRHRPYAFAPIRTRPQRTYDPLKEVPKPEGSHVPMVLAKVFLEKTEGSKRLKAALNDFGKASGLFDSVEVKRKGQKESDPFQIGIKTTAQSFNLVDVGYGVSQVLPIVVDVLRNPEGSTFLLQQPEVHLHPKAQAELGSFLAALAKEQNKRFVIETHSDYLIDRVRMDIRDNKYLSPDDVAILYFEKSQGGVNIHQLELDNYGNITNTPSTYRQFFLEEERRMLGV